ncbi:hypothetical protein NDN16_19155 [Aureimonas altamirensis]|uniref:hypothetical protein n=1 Tax=Aureimonas TaxID=414371 RepID=UPI00177CE63D|nr:MULTISPECIES: hypothetical protein [Aureimonas]MCM2505785.1 hypothetical protein [Aureimonas altamirensis]QOG05137.1 hypothetical protein IGS74_10775 [Aureimonas sp. OT7]
MNASVQNAPIMSSRVFAEVIDKRHDNVSLARPSNAMAAIVTETDFTGATVEIGAAVGLIVDGETFVAREARS